MNAGHDNPQTTFSRHVLRYCRQHRLFDDCPLLVVAVSGGPDSVCLLGILTALKDELDIDLHVAHLDHKLRGEESDGDARYVENLAERFGLPCTIGERDVEAFRTEHGGTLEEAAREVRYDFLAETARSLGTDTVVTGHTRDDAIETILLHIVRGTGTRGLRGLLPETAIETPSGTIRILRPLLEISRTETVGYCTENNLDPRMDSTNESLAPLRNRIRQQLIPLMENYNERFGDALLRLSSAASDELDFLDETVSDIVDEVVRREESTVIIDKERFYELHPALRRHLLRQIIEEISGNLKDIETRHIAEIIETMEKQAGKRIDLPGGLVFTVEYDRFLLGYETGQLSPLPPLADEFSLKVPGETIVPGWVILASVIEPEQAENPDNDFTANFDYSRTGDELTVRSRKTADRFQPLGMSGSKKVGEYMIDTKIPQSWRDRVPIVCSPEQIIWVTGWRIDDRVKVNPETEKVLRLEFIKTKE